MVSGFSDYVMIKHSVDNPAGTGWIDGEGCSKLLTYPPIERNDLYIASVVL